MVKKISFIVSVTLLVVSVVQVILILRKPSMREIPTSKEASESFDQKLVRAQEAHQQGESKEIRITESELNSKLQEDLEGAPAADEGPNPLRGIMVHLEGDKVEPTFVVDVKGLDLYVTLTGTLGISDHSLVFNPTGLRMGSHPIPMVLIESKLRERFDSPDMRERMKLPESIKDVRIENGEVVVVTQ